MIIISLMIIVIRMIGVCLSVRDKTMKEIMMIVMISFFIPISLKRAINKPGNLTLFFKGPIEPLCQYLYARTTKIYSHNPEIGTQIEKNVL